ncbi:MAG: hypothetical protein FD189_63 [Elusimicrobia bacterium]|nr:MAG: hypothetical protein FD154_215 [Elusimicrobiota bacterium]KAF0158421.1 MAG: hypothetical protein FD189_63 [Elusimicrobiota bacterium]
MLRMGSGTKAALLAAAAALCAGLVYHLAFGQTPVPEAVRRLSGLRIAAELYRQAEGTFPLDYGAVPASGKLEAVPALKLKWRPACSRVVNYPSLEPAGTGCWGYVADPGSPDFGSVFIDSGAKDPAGRYWTWF